MVEKKKILFLSDHPLSTSGVGTQARYLISGLIATGKYTFRCFGGAIKHDNYETIIVNHDFIIKPTDGFGNREMLRLAIASERPDALVLFTDPRFFIWTWEMEEEIHQVCPIVFNHLWDDCSHPPEFNRVLYDSTDMVNCINYPTYEMTRDHMKHKRVNYIPHALPNELFYPLPKEDVVKFKKQLLQGKPDDEFVGIWVSRNARRKMPSDALASWKMFVDKLEKKHGHRNATLIMHTDPLDQEGPNLYQVVEHLNLSRNILFSKERVSFENMNRLYNITDFCVNTSVAEGFGLGTLEAMQCGKPIIAIKSGGGQTRQVIDWRDGSENGVALDPDLRTLVGSQLVPWIEEQMCTHETFASAFMKMYEFGPAERERLGQKARNYVLSEYSLADTVKKWDVTLEECIQNWKRDYKPWECVRV